MQIRLTGKNLWFFSMHTCIMPTECPVKVNTWRSLRLRTLCSRSTSLRFKPVAFSSHVTTNLDKAIFYYKSWLNKKQELPRNVIRLKYSISDVNWILLTKQVKISIEFYSNLNFLLCNAAKFVSHHFCTCKIISSRWQFFTSFKPCRYLRVFFKASTQFLRLKGKMGNNQFQSRFNGNSLKCATYDNIGDRNENDSIGQCWLLTSSHVIISFQKCIEQFQCFEKILTMFIRNGSCFQIDRWILKIEISNMLVKVRRQSNKNTRNFLLE